MLSKKSLYKNKPDDVISWVDNPDEKGVWEFTFDGKKFYNLFADYPHNLTEQEKEIFDKESPYWRGFFSDRQ